MKYKFFIVTVLIACVIVTSVILVLKISDYKNDNSATPTITVDVENLTTNFKEVIEPKYSFDDYFGGMYIDKEGRYIVNIVEGGVNIVEELSERNKVNNVIYNYVKYSLKHLQDVQELLNEAPSLYDINSTALIIPDNKIYVYVNELDEDKTNKIKELINDSSIVIKNKDYYINFN